MGSRSHLSAMGVVAFGIVALGACGSFGESNSSPVGSGSTAVGCDLDGGARGIACGGQCVDPARDPAHCGRCEARCDASASCEGTCTAVADSLVAFRYELPCIADDAGTAGSPFDAIACTTPPLVTSESVLVGTPGKEYALRIRIRGILAERFYVGATTAGATGTNASCFVTAPPSPPEERNSLWLTVSEPPQTYYLNAGRAIAYELVPIDYRVTITARAGAKLVVGSESTDERIIRNRDGDGRPIVLPDIPPAPGAFDGQFLQIDVESVHVLP